MKTFCAFLGGAVVGAAAALLLAPEKGEDLRGQIMDLLRRKGIIRGEADVDDLVDQIAAQIDEVKTEH